LSDIIGVPQVQKKEGAAKHRDLPPPLKGLRKHKSPHDGNIALKKGFISGKSP
jgi:hypothetical protein